MYQLKHIQKKENNITEKSKIYSRFSEFNKLNQQVLSLLLC